MSFTPAIKHANHRIYQVIQEQKKALTELLLSQNSDASVLIVAQNDLSFLQEALVHPKLTLADDTALENLSQSYDILISYDLPNEAQTYLKRLSFAKDKAFLLLDAHEQNALYQIEVLLGRAIKQESLEGFGYPIKEEIKKEPLHKKTPNEKRVYDKKIHEKPRNSQTKYADKGEKKPFKKSDKPFKEGEKKPFKKSDKPFTEGGKKPYAKKEQQGKKQNNFLGYDENGKAIFSGKSGERNHRYDGKPKEFSDATQAKPKKVGKTINIKELKKKPEEK
jgi:hypothetical protein